MVLYELMFVNVEELMASTRLICFVLPGGGLARLVETDTLGELCVIFCFCFFSFMFLEFRGSNIICNPQRVGDERSSHMNASIGAIVLAL